MTYLIFSLAVIFTLALTFIISAIVEHILTKDAVKEIYKIKRDYK